MATQVYKMVGWRYEAPNNGLPERHVFLGMHAEALCIVTRIPLEVAQQVGYKADDWGFECRLQGGSFIHAFFSAETPIDDVKQKAAAVISDLIRNNKPVH